tara:strand:+ start:22601 stop:25798 length:3198 start_codon:yes stop_codon:yes gene_type:complete
MSASLDAFPRDEAELLGDQKQAFTFIKTAVDDLVKANELIERATGSELCPLDSKRHNQAFLISGKRGTGKTTILLSVLKHWIGDWKEHKESRICPIGIVDLQPLPGSTSLVLHVATQLLRVVEGIEDNLEPENREFSEHEFSIESRKKWRTLLRAVAAAWDEGVQTRRATLDIDSYALELEHVERERLTVPLAFREFVDALVKDAEKGLPDAGANTVFVIPIDDADMNPKRCVELLNVMRTLWHPNIVFVLTGDEELFMQTAAATFMQEFGLPHWASGEAGSYYEKTAKGLARDFFNKVVAAGNRSQVRALPLSIRLAKIEEALSAIRVDDESLFNRFSECAQYQEALPLRFRELNDLSAKLEGSPSENLLWPEAVSLLWLEAVNQSEFPASLQQQLAGTVRTSILGGISLDPVFDGGQVILAYESPKLAVAGRLDMRVTFRSPARLSLAIARQFEHTDDSDDDLIDQDTEPRATGLLTPASSRMTAAIVLASDIALEHPDICEFLGRSLSGAPPDFVNVRHEELLGSLRWPFPKGLPHHVLSRFEELWRMEVLRIAKNQRLNDEDLGYLARFYIDSILDLLDPPHAEHASETRTWTSVGKRLHEQEGRRSQRPLIGPILNWIEIDLPLFALPETGLPVEDANAIAQHVMAKSNFERIKRLLRKNRVDVLGRANRGDFLRDTASVIETFYDQNPDFHLSTALATNKEIERRKDRLVQSLPRLSINVGGFMNGVLRNARQGNELQGYISSRLRRDLLLDSDKSILATWQKSVERRESSPNGLFSALPELWQLANADNTSREERQVVIAGGHLGATGVATREPLLTNQKHLRQSSGLVLTATALAGPVMTPPFSSPLTELTFRIAYDVSMDSHDGDGSTASITRAAGPQDFAGAVLRRNYVELSRWQVPSWPTVIDEELFFEMWSDLVQELPTEASTTNVDDDNLIDAVAYALLEGCEGIMLRRAAKPTPNFNIQLDDWKQVMQRFTKYLSNPEPPSLRNHRFMLWIQSLGMYATPELGLSHGACDAILKSLSIDQYTGAYERRRELGRAEDLETYRNHPFILRNHE